MIMADKVDNYKGLSDKAKRRILQRDNRFLFIYDIMKRSDMNYD